MEDKILTEMTKFYYEENSKQTNPASDEDIQEQIYSDYAQLKEHMMKTNNKEK